LGRRLSLARLLRLELLLLLAPAAASLGPVAVLIGCRLFFQHALQTGELRAHRLDEGTVVASGAARIVELGQGLDALGRQLEGSAGVAERAASNNQSRAGQLNQLLEQLALGVGCRLGGEAELVQRRQARP